MLFDNVLFRSGLSRSAYLFVSCIISLCMASAAWAITPSGGWELKDATPDVKDYYLQINVDPGETYDVSTTSPSSVYWAQYITFNQASGGYLGLQRTGGVKYAIVSIWDALAAKGNTLPAVNCYEDGPCQSVKGDYDWKVGHQYRFRVERSPRHDAGDNWWQITLADLTTSTEDILGEIQTPEWGGLSVNNGLFLEYFWGPYTCDSLRHAKGTMHAIQGNWGQTKKLLNFNGTAYGEPDICDSTYMLPGMSPVDYGSSSWADSNGTVITLGNNYRGLQQWGDFEHVAKKGMMFTADVNADDPIIYRALHDGVYGPFPADRKDNADWQVLGKGYPIINDLFLRNQPLREWEQRNDSNITLGDYFIYDNPYTHDLEYFKLLKKGAGYFPTNKTSNEYWEYVGRHSINNEKVPDLEIHSWDKNNRYGRVGSVYQDGKQYYRLQTSGEYGVFPDGEFENQWWELIGTHP